MMQPVSFLQFIWAIMIGFLLFGESVDAFVVLGALTIIGAVFYITLREGQLKQRYERTGL
jgi:drug/metabolite transporter (DMT)-like permease